MPARLPFAVALSVAAITVSSAAGAQPSAAPTTPQSTTSSPARFGVKLGLNSATLSISTQSEVPYERMTSFAIGGAGVMSLGGSVSVQAELLYTRKGTGVDTGAGAPSAALHLDYIEVPVMARYDVHTAGSTRPFVYAGAALGLFLSGEAVFDGRSEDIDDEAITSTDVGLVAGGGAELPTEFGAITLELRYTHGITNLDDTDGDDEVYNRVLSLFVGVML